MNPARWAACATIRRNPTELFNGPAPAALVTALKKQPGTWKEVFGRVAEEAFNAYYLSSYINEVARAGKEIYPLPTYVNVWNGGYGTNDNFDLFDRPGETYPSGGAVVAHAGLVESQRAGHRRHRFGYLPPIPDELPDDPRSLHPAG